MYDNWKVIILGVFLFLKKVIGYYLANYNYMSYKYKSMPNV